LDGCPVEAMDYADDEQRVIITNTQFDSDYNSSYSSKSQLKKLCHKSYCDLCKCVGRKVRTPDVMLVEQIHARNK
jgi:hypothetical protein